jgi:hypothetical protein
MNDIYCMRSRLLTLHVASFQFTAVVITIIVTAISIISSIIRIEIPKIEAVNIFIRFLK